MFGEHGHDWVVDTWWIDRVVSDAGSTLFFSWVGLKAALLRLKRQEAQLFQGPATVDHVVFLPVCFFRLMGGHVATDTRFVTVTLKIVALCTRRTLTNLNATRRARAAGHVVWEWHTASGVVGSHTMGGRSSRCLRSLSGSFSCFELALAFIVASAAASVLRCDDFCMYVFV